MSRLTPLAEVEISGQSGLVSIDTGANRTTLSASYATRIGDRARFWSTRPDTCLGLGGSQEGDVALEPQLMFQAGSATVVEHDIIIALDGDKASPILGHLGQSGLASANGYTLDFRSMRLLLGSEEPGSSGGEGPSLYRPVEHLSSLILRTAE